MVLDEGQHRERDQDTARALRQIRDSALANFIQTRTHPRLFWKPAEVDDKIRELLGETKARLDEKR